MKDNEVKPGVIKNPTVFLKDGELYCLTVEVPKRPQPEAYGYVGDGSTGWTAWYADTSSTSKSKYYKRAFKKYNKDLTSAKSSAVKVKNQEEADCAIYKSQDWRLLPKLDLMNGNIYTLTGYEAKMDELCAKLSCAQSGSCYAEGLSFETCAAQKFATITPIEDKKEVTHSIHCPAYTTDNLLKRGHRIGECNCNKKEVKPDFEKLAEIEFSKLLKYADTPIVQDETYLPASEVSKALERVAKSILTDFVEPTRAENKELLSKIKEIEKLSRYDKNHDNILYKLKEIHELVQSLISKYEKK